MNLVTRRSCRSHPKEERPGFYTVIFGTHQSLGNGNILVSEGKAGRIFEVDRLGNIVWEYISRYDEASASLVEAAHRYDTDYFDVEDWSCDNTVVQ